MAEVTVKKVEALHRALVKGSSTKLSALGQSLTAAAGIELACALYQTGQGMDMRKILGDASCSGMWGLIRASGWPWEAKAQELQDGNCSLRTLAGNEADPRLLPFVQNMQRTLKSSGLSSRFARAVAGAFLEMAGNIGEHSLTPRSAMIGYEFAHGRITCCIADVGVGVLESLRTNPKYQRLQTSAQALDEALKDGVSRFGESGRGYGFSDLLRAIAEQWGIARLRTGEAKLIFDRTTEHRTKTSGYCPSIPGLQIVFTCGTKAPPSNFNL